MDDGRSAPELTLWLNIVDLGIKAGVALTGVTTAAAALVLWMMLPRSLQQIAVFITVVGTLTTLTVPSGLVIPALAWFSGGCRGRGRRDRARPPSRRYRRPPVAPPPVELLSRATRAMRVEAERTRWISVAAAMTAGSVPFGVGAAEPRDRPGDRDHRDERVERPDDQGR